MCACMCACMGACMCACMGACALTKPPVWPSQSTEAQGWWFPHSHSLDVASTGCFMVCDAGVWPQGLDPEEAERRERALLQWEEGKKLTAKLEALKWVAARVKPADPNKPT
jgi:hypothetical protein